MSWHYLQGQAEVSSEESCLGGKQCVPSKSALSTLTFVFLACTCSSVPPSVFVTPNGVTVDARRAPPPTPEGYFEDETGLDWGWDLLSVSKWESVSLASFEAVLDARFSDARDRVRGYVVTVYGSRYFMSPTGPASLFVDCKERRIFLGSSHPGQGDLTHALAHAVQDCKPTEPEDLDNPEHANWERDGIVDAVRRVFSAWVSE